MVSRGSNGQLRPRIGREGVVKLYHITKKGWAASILREGFKKPQQEGIIRRPWEPKALFGQQGEDRVSMTLGGVMAKPFLTMIRKLHGEDLAVVICQVDVEAVRVFSSIAFTHDLMGKRMMHGLSIEITAPRAAVKAEGIISIEELLSMPTLKGVPLEFWMMWAKTEVENIKTSISWEHFGDGVIRRWRMLIPMYAGYRVYPRSVRVAIWWVIYPNVIQDRWLLRRSPNPAQREEFERLIQEMRSILLG